MTPSSTSTGSTSRHASVHTAAVDVDARGLASALEHTIGGEVRFGDGDRHLYSTDASNYRQLPIGVVLPRTVEDIVKTVKICRQFGAPITNRGGGTSLAGQATNVAVILDTSKYLRDIVDLDVDGRVATVRAGLVLDTLRDEIAPHGLTWGPNPATHNRCTVGGMLGNNACGMHAYAYGRAQDNVRSMQVLLYDGTVMTVGPTPDGELERIIGEGGRKGAIHGRLLDLRDRYADAIRTDFPAIPRRVSGYNLEELLTENGCNVARALVGSEGTCVTILEATLELNPAPGSTALLVLGFPDVYVAGDHVPAIRGTDGLYTVEGMDRRLVDGVRARGLGGGALASLPDGGAYLLLEFGGGSAAEARTRAEDLQAALAGGGADLSGTRLYTTPQDMDDVWGAREAALGTTSYTGDVHHWPGWEDSAVAPEDVGTYLRDLRALLDDYGYDASFYGHFGEGCVHSRIDFDLTTADGVGRYRAFVEDAADLVSSYGGSYSGEHGDGQQRGELLERMYGPEIVRAMQEFKAIFDPDNKMNPGKIVEPYKLDENLRLGETHRQWRPETKFAYPDDDHDFNRAQLRCVGVGKCRRDDGNGTMCPSYMVTHEEKHSTRGRARLLFEMLQPDSQLDGWRDETVKEALDLCLSCKGCVTDCPVNVDIPTYKAEFLYHHYEGRLHPRVDYAMGLINVWSRIASWMPGIANLALNAPGVGWLLKSAAGVATQRPAPRYAAETFREWFENRDVRAVDRPRVILFPDTFTNHFHPEVGKATVSVLEHAGYEVTIPPRVACCGRPFYDYGFLDLAEAYLERLIDTFREDVAAGVKIVGMEPSCVATFRDELVQMKPHDADATRIAASTLTLAEFLVDEADYSFPTLQRQAIVHGHCHHKAAMGMSADAQALDRLGLEWDELDAGCCGLAGSFGFEAGDSFDVSVKAGERKLLPAVRGASPNTLVIADGFSCRTQIQQLQHINGTNGSPERRALHLAQVIEMGRDEGPIGPPLDRDVVESGYVGDDTNATFTKKDALVAGVGAVVLGAAGLAWWARRKASR